MIVGRFHRGDPHPISWIDVGVWLPGISQEWAVAPFVVDTGAGTTCLHPGDALSIVRINPLLLGDPMRWPRAVTYQGIGGRTTYFQSPVRYRLRHDDGPEQFRESTIHVAPWSREMEALPSVLGWDVLRHFRVVLDWSLWSVELHALAPPHASSPASP